MLGPSISSYEKTNIPRYVAQSRAINFNEAGYARGAPKRYNSRGVIRMLPNPKMPIHDQSVDGPGEAVETEAQRQLKTLLNKQLQPSLDIARV